MMWLLLVLALALGLAVQSAHAQEASAPEGEDQTAEAEEAWDDDDDWLFDAGPDPAERDAFEGSNRATFGFNERFYVWVADPITSGFNWLVPDVVPVPRRGVHHEAGRLVDDREGIVLVHHGER
jgi:ABC-type transporter lipoprotein component MlaA